MVYFSLRKQFFSAHTMLEPTYRAGATMFICYFFHLDHSAQELKLNVVVLMPKFLFIIFLILFVIRCWLNIYLKIIWGWVVSINTLLLAIYVFWSDDVDFIKHFINVFSSLSMFCIYMLSVSLYLFLMNARHGMCIASMLGHVMYKISCRSVK